MIINLLAETYKKTQQYFGRHSNRKILVTGGNLQSFVPSKLKPVNCKICYSEVEKRNDDPRYKITTIYVELQDAILTKIHFGCIINALQAEIGVNSYPFINTLYMMWDVLRELIQVPCDDKILSTIKNSLVICLYTAIKPICIEIPRLIHLNISDCEKFREILKNDGRNCLPSVIFVINIISSQIKFINTKVPNILPKEKIKLCVNFYMVIQRIYAEAPSNNTALRLILDDILPKFLDNFENDEVSYWSSTIAYIAINTGPKIANKLIRSTDVLMLLQHAVAKSAYGIIFELKCITIRVSKEQAIFLVEYIVHLNLSEVIGFKHIIEYFEFFDLLNSALIITIVKISMNSKAVKDGEIGTQENYCWSGLWVLYDHLQPCNVSSETICEIIMIHHSHGLLRRNLFNHFFRRFYKKIDIDRFTEILKLIERDLSFSLVDFMIRSIVNKKDSVLKIAPILGNYKFSERRGRDVFKYLIKYNIIISRNFIQLFEYLIKHGKYPAVTGNIFSYAPPSFIEAGFKRSPNQLITICNELNCIGRVVPLVIGLNNLKDAYTLTTNSVKRIIEYLRHSKGFPMQVVVVALSMGKGVTFILHFVLTVENLIDSESMPFIEDIIDEMIKSPLFNTLVATSEIEKILQILKGKLKYTNSVNLLERELYFREHSDCYF
ncbi:hypothetical protein PAEPH01_1630 [Pancytospora epiphaga]|nr:hypothetical protein PAEPH01_1630 [Pancytospora epiphaga]